MLRKVIPLLLLLAMGVRYSYAQTNMSASPCPAIPPYPGAICANGANWQWDNGGVWSNMNQGAGGSTPAGPTGAIQVNGGSNLFGAYNGTICTNQAMSALSQSGAATCSTVTSAYTDTSIAKTGTDINTSNQVTSTHLASPLSPTQGGSGLSNPTADAILYALGSSPFGTLVLTDNQFLLGHTGGAPTALTMSDCTADSAHADQWNATTHTFNCNAITATASAAGSSGNVQYNNAGALGGVGGTGFVMSNGSSAPTVVPYLRIYASNYGAVGDDSTDDTTALTNAEAAAEALAGANPVIASGWAKQGIVVLDAGKTYKISGNGISANLGKVGWQFNGSCLDARTVTSGQVAFTATSPANSYNSGDLDHPCIFGPSQSSNTVGLMLAANHVHVKQPNISSFQTCEGIGDNSYTNDHIGGQIFNCGTAVDTCQQTATNKGEGINYLGTNIFNSTTGIHDGCDGGGNSAAIYLTNVHLDGMSGTVIRNNAGSVDAADSYVEDIGATAGASIINNGNACSNQYCYVRWIGGQIQADSVTNPNIAQVITNNNNGSTYGVSPWVQLNGVALKGFLPSASCANGSGDTCITGNAAGYVSLKNITTLDGLYDTPALGNDHFPYYPNQMPTCSGGFNAGMHWTVYQVPACVAGKTMDAALAGTNICDAFCDGSRIIIANTTSGAVATSELAVRTGLTLVAGAL